MAQKIRIQSSPSVNNEDVVIKEDLSQIHIPSPSVYRITEMFDFPSEADFIAVMYKAEKEGERDMIRIWADDTSGITADLTITPQMGFGCYNQPAPIIGWSKDAETDAAFAYEITISQETLNLPTRIFIPTECNKVDLFYFVGNNPVNSSYFVDTNGVYHTFELENTPIENFVEDIYVINGNNVDKQTIAELYIKNSYLLLPTTKLGNRAFYSMLNLVKIDFSGLRSVTSVSANFVRWCGKLTSLDLRSFVNLVSAGGFFLGTTTALKEIIIGNIDWSLINVVNTHTSFTNAPQNGIVYSSTLELGEKFLAKFSNLVDAEWTISIIE